VDSAQDTALIGGIAFALTHALRAAFPALGGKWLHLVALGCCVLAGAVMVTAFGAEPKATLAQVCVAVPAAIGTNEITRKADAE